MKIVCAKSVLAGEELFSSLGDVVLVPEEEITPAHLQDADILITRTKCRIDRALLADTPVKFVGCAVAGTDHIDYASLQDLDVACIHAPGCNAASVADYVVTALLLEAERHGRDITASTLGLTGVGHIGRRVAARATAMGFTVLLNDPPRAAQEGTDKWSFMELADVLPVADFVTVHVPYSQSGPFPTAHLLDYRFFESMAPGALLINAARGGVMDSDACLAALEHGPLRQATLDVWEDEPTIRRDLLDAVDFATPHIAGYSLDGRLRGTQMIYEACCRFLEEEPALSVDVDRWPAPEPRTLDVTGQSTQTVLTNLARLAYPLSDDDARFRAGASSDPARMARHFVTCRREYPVRREFSAHRFELVGAPDEVKQAARGCGFTIG